MTVFYIHIKHMYIYYSYLFGYPTLTSTLLPRIWLLKNLPTRILCNSFVKSKFLQLSPIAGPILLFLWH